MMKKTIFFIVFFAVIFPRADVFALPIIYTANLEAPPGGGYSDSFTDDDDTTLPDHDSNWDRGRWANNFEIISNVAQPTAIYTPASARYIASSSDTSQAIVKAGAVEKYVNVRMGAATDGYQVRMDSGSGGNWTTLTAYKNGVYLGAFSTGLSLAQSSDHTLKISASGTTTVTLTAWYDSTEASSTVQDSNSTITSGNPGFSANNAPSDPADAGFDDWQDY